MLAAVGQARDLADAQAPPPHIGNLFAVDVFHGHAQGPVAHQAHGEDHFAAALGDEHRRRRQQVIGRHSHAVAVVLADPAPQVRRVDQAEGGFPLLPRGCNAITDVFCCLW